MPALDGGAVAGLLIGAVVAAWMNSPPHRRHILDPDLRLAGIGIAHGTPFTPEGATYTAELGSAR